MSLSRTEDIRLFPRTEHSVASCLSLWTEGQPGRLKQSSLCPCQIYQRVHRSRGRREKADGNK